MYNIEKDTGENSRNSNFKIYYFLSREYDQTNEPYRVRSGCLFTQ